MRVVVDRRPITAKMMDSIRFNAFVLNSPSHLCPGLWRHPDDRSTSHTSMRHWLELAKTLEEGLFDAIFFADVLGPHDTYRGGLHVSIEAGAQFPVNDPLPAIVGMSTVTRDLCFGFTSSVFSDHPYVFARRMSTLDQLTDGRVAWNVVTSYLPAAMANLGVSRLAAHDQRYEYAEEYMEICYKLWEGSWKDDALREDRRTGIFAYPSSIRSIDHRGTYFDVPGVHMSGPSPQRTPLLFQAGASSRGVAFCAKHAECAFILGHSKQTVSQTVSRIRNAAVAAGRAPDSIRIFAQITLIVGEDEAAARRKSDDFSTYVNRDATLNLLSGWLGTDLAGHDLHRPLAHFESNAIRSLADEFARGSAGGAWTLGKLISWAGIGGLGPVLTGSAEQVANDLIEWADETGVDGFNLPYVTVPGTYIDIARLLVPVLQRKGAYRTEYQPGTFREKLFHAGNRVAEGHPAARYR